MSLVASSIGSSSVVEQDPFGLGQDMIAEGASPSSLSLLPPLLSSLLAYLF